MLVETHALGKSFAGHWALQDCCLRVSAGETFGLLGPNGSGKTTMIRLLLGFLRPSSGQAFIDGFDCDRQSLNVRQRVAYLPAEARVFQTMRGHQALKFFAGLRGGQVRQSLEVAERLELNLATRVAAMSTGMRQKLALAATLAAKTPLLILDEPTANLDPTVRGTVIALVREARDQGRTVLFSSHVLSEIEEACDRVAILRRGELVHTQVISQLRQRHRIRAELDGPLPVVPEELGDVELRHANEGARHDAHQDESGHRRQNVVTMETGEQLRPFLAWLSSLPLSNIHIEPVGLRSVYDAYHIADAPNPPPVAAVASATDLESL